MTTMTTKMTKASAAKALRDRDILKRTFTLEDRGAKWATTPEQRETAMAEVQRIQSEHREQPIRGEARKQLDAAFAIAQRHRYRAGRAESVAGIGFFVIEAVGDSWADVVADYARKRDADRRRYAKERKETP